MGKVPRRFDLPRWLDAVNAIESDLQSITSQLTESEFHAPPRSGGWSIGYCLEHIVLSGEAFLVEWDSALRKAPPDNDNRPMPGYRWWERMFLNVVEPPYRMKLKTPRTFHPLSRRSMAETVQKIQQMHQEFTKRAVASQQVEAQGVRVRSPFASQIKYPLGFTFDLALAHERRHLWQAKQIHQSIPK